MDTITLIISGVLIVIAVLLLRWRLAKRRTTLGAAHWLPAWTASGLKLFGKDGLLIGDWSGRLPVVYNGGGHALTVAPTGCGKGTSAILPNLLRHPWIFLVDPGGENAAVASRAWRNRGFHFLCLNPWGMHSNAPWTLPSHTLNPLAILDPASGSFVSDADLLAEMIVSRTGRESGSSAYFKDEAQSGLRAMIMHLVTAEPPARRNFLTLRQYITAQAHEWAALIAAMKANNAAGGAIAREAAQFERREVQAPEEYSAIISTMKQDTNFIEDPVMQKALGGLSADLAALKGSLNGKEIPGCVVAVVIPLQYIDTHAVYARLITAVALWTMMQEPLSRGRVLFVLDEFPALGPMKRISAGLATLRKYKVWLWPIIQNLGQLKNLYGQNWQTFISNAGLLQFIGAGDLETAQYVSALLGQTTIEVSSRGPGGSSFYETKRELATADEILRLRRDLQIVSVDNLQPMVLKKTPYWERAELRGRFHPNPYHAGTPSISWLALPAMAWGYWLRFAAWLMRPASSVVALLTMAAVYLIDPAINVGKSYDRLHAQIVCTYDGLIGRRIHVIDSMLVTPCPSFVVRGMWDWKE